VLSKAFDRRRHLALERLPAHLAVSDDFQFGFLSQRDRSVHCFVFDLLNSAAVIAPSASCFCAASNSGGRSRLPTTSDRTLIMRDREESYHTALGPI